MQRVDFFIRASFFSSGDVAISVAISQHDAKSEGRVSQLEKSQRSFIDCSFMDFGEPALGGRFRLRCAGWTLACRVALSFPIGPLPAWQLWVD
jgi:hypothetical protein